MRRPAPQQRRRTLRASPSMSRREETPSASARCREYTPRAPKRPRGEAPHRGRGTNTRGDRDRAERGAGFGERKRGAAAELVEGEAGAAEERGSARGAEQSRRKLSSRTTRSPSWPRLSAAWPAIRRGSLR